MPCPLTKSAVESCWKSTKQNELSCILAAPSPVEAVETQRVSAHSVCVSAESAWSHQAHKIWCISTLTPAVMCVGLWRRRAGPSLLEETGRLGSTSCCRGSGSSRPSVIEPRRCPCLPNFRQPHNDIPLKHLCDFNGGCLQQMVCHTLEYLTILHLVEILPERLLLQSDSCARNTNINVKSR